MDTNQISPTFSVFFRKNWQYKFFEINLFAETAENGRRSEVRDGEKRKSANFELRTTKTEVGSDSGGISAEIWLGVLSKEL